MRVETKQLLMTGLAAVGLAGCAEPATAPLVGSLEWDRVAVTAELSEPYSAAWHERVESALAESGLSAPEDPYQRSGGREGYHTEHLGHLLAEMQWMDRAYPGLEW